MPDRLRQYRARPAQEKSKRPARAYASASSGLVARARSSITSSVKIRARSSSVPGRSSSALTRRVHSSIRVQRSWKCTRGAGCGPKCVRNNWSGCHARMRSVVARQDSRSMSGGGVGGRTTRPLGRQMPAASPTKAIRAAGREVTDVMPGVAGRPDPLEIVADNGEMFGGFGGSRPEPPSRPASGPRHRPHVAPESLHVGAVQTGGAGEELRGIGQVGGAPLVHVHDRARTLGRERAHGAGVIEVDMREQNGPHIRHGESTCGERAPQRGQCGRRPGIDQRDALAAVQNRRGDDFRGAEKVEVEVVEAGAEGHHVEQ